VKSVFLSLLVLCPVFAGEYAVLNTGFRVYADRHEVLGDAITRLHTSTGTVDVPSGSISSFEVEEYVRPTPPPAPPPTPVAAAPAPAPVLTPQELVEQAALFHGLRPEFVRSVASVESAFRKAAISPKGAIGLMQLMPGTAVDLGVNPHDPAQNAHGGAKYLKELLLRYQNTQDPVRFALAAYNAGPGAVDKYGNVPPYRETRQYVEKVLRKYLAELKQP
jgi:soluble lytic murein transglycosylase-like protein